MFVTKHFWVIGTPAQEEIDFLNGEDVISHVLSERWAREPLSDRVVVVSNDSLIIKSGIDFLLFALEGKVAQDDAGRRAWLEDHKGAVDKFLRDEELQEGLDLLNREQQMYDSEEQEHDDYWEVRSALTRLATDAVNEMILRDQMNE